MKGKDKKRNFCEKAYALYEGRGLILNAQKSRMFPLKETQGEKLKILTV